ncbi:hypothetical protein ACWEQ0_23845 [Nocardia thailandica]
MHESEAEAIAKAAATPSLPEISTALNVVLDLVQGARPVEESAAVEAVRAALGITRSSGGRLTINEAEEIRSSPIVQTAKARHATRLAIAKLLAQGILVPLAVLDNRRDSMFERVDTFAGGTMSSRSSSIEVPLGSVLVPSVFRLTPGLEVEGVVPLLTVEKWQVELAPLLNARLLRSLEEALSAARRGSHLSCAALLGSVSEGAWYAAGEQLRTRDKKLAEALDDDRTATVQTKVAELVTQTGRDKAAVAGLIAFATQLRQVRNYGVHTTATDDVAAEEFFTETGNYTLILATYSHLVKLLSMVRALDPALFP